jgi:alanine racemase
MSTTPVNRAAAGPSAGVSTGSYVTPADPLPVRSRATANVDLDAIASNVRVLRGMAPDSQLMAVVKADGYGHGLLASARAARAGGADWLGTALLQEALALRAAGDTGPILSWLLDPLDDWQGAVAAGIDLSVSAPWAIGPIVLAAKATGRRARLHLKIDSGLGRNGATPADWSVLCHLVAQLEREGVVDVVGVWSHLANADMPFHPTIDEQRAVFLDAVDVARAAGLTPSLRHLANSAATVSRPDLHFDLVRPGLAVYGLSPMPDSHPAAGLGLRPAMRLSARVALAKRVPAGSGVSYNHRYTTTTETTLALVPLGYADGVPRAATNVGPVLAAGSVRRIAGTVCMDQFVLDVGDDVVHAGDEVVLFGDADRGEPTADDWAAATGTISYEIVTRLGPRVPRTWTAAAAAAPAP